MNYLGTFLLLLCAIRAMVPQGSVVSSMLILLYTSMTCCLVVKEVSHRISARPYNAYYSFACPYTCPVTPPALSSVSPATAPIMPPLMPPAIPSEMLASNIPRSPPPCASVPSCDRYQEGYIPPIYLTVTGDFHNDDYKSKDEASPLPYQLRIMPQSSPCQNKPQPKNQDPSPSPQPLPQQLKSSPPPSTPSRRSGLFSSLFSIPGAVADSLLTGEINI